MSPQKATAAMSGRGFASAASACGRFGPFEQTRTRFRAAGAPASRVDVVAYFVDSIGLTCVVVDALTGPRSRWTESD
ncbi:hypothetical protein [Embleya sp. NBC_00896]|uniref:hypothetical protein n=1 Tax=Embleya sp. NBC_00896 TaxID=2975961 RepID=UPI00386EFFF5|nr:hypothetical protein OG928_47330 [Embleya sp. NBC_00896]